MSTCCKSIKGVDGAPTGKWIHWWRMSGVRGTGETTLIRSSWKRIKPTGEGEGAPLPSVTLIVYALSQLTSFYFCFDVKATKQEAEGEK